MSKSIKTSIPGVYKRGAGYVYVLRVEGKQRWVSTWPDGRPFANVKDAGKARRAALDRVDSGTDVAPDKVTVAEYLAEWLALQRSQVKPLTLESYGQLVNRYIVPALGERPLQSLRTAHVTAFYDQLHRCGGRSTQQVPGGKTLSLRTVRYVHSVLRKALSDAASEGRVVVNVASAAKLPKVAHAVDPLALPAAAAAPLSVWSTDEVRRFESVAGGDRLGPVFALALQTGMRRGEVLGLRWDDVEKHDDGKATIHVRQGLVKVGGQLQFSTPKNGKTRSFKVGPRTVALLDRQKRAQAKEQLAWAGPWGNKAGLVFTAEDGSPIPPEHASLIFQRLVRESAVTRIRLHDCRHTYATHALVAGVNIKTVSQRLGHSSVQITWDTYSHVLPEQDDQAADMFERHVYGQVL